jgi:uncharacterized membrane protein YkoI
MARTFFIAWVLLLGGVIVLWPLQADDHDEARGLREQGAILPLVQLLARPELAGQRVIEAELERKRGRMIYELELMDDAGQVHKLRYDAASGKPLPDQGHD